MKEDESSDDQERDDNAPQPPAKGAGIADPENDGATESGKRERESHNPIKAFSRLTANEKITALLSFGTLIVSGLTYVNALDTKDMRDAVTHLSDLANASEVEAVTMGNEVSGINNEVAALRDQSNTTRLLVEPTIRSADAANISAQTAIKISKSNVDFSKRQLRAYLNAIYLTPVDQGSSILYNVTFENDGQTPAYNVMTRVTCVTIEDAGPSTALPHLETRHLGFSKATVLPKKTLNNNVSCAFQFGDPKILDRSSTAFIYGWASYIDIFGSHHISEYKFFYDPKKMHFVTAENGNSDN